MGVWEDLPRPLLGLILDRLPVTDYFRFPGVCTSWRDAQHEHRLLHATSPRHLLQMPCLMMVDESQEGSYSGFFDLSEQRYYQLSLPKLEGKCVHGVSHGWLLVVDNISHMLVSPFTGSEIVIPRLPQHRYCKSLRGIWSSFPTDPDCVILLLDASIMFSPYKHSLFLCHVRNKSRIELFHPKGFFYGIPTFCKGKFYCLETTSVGHLVMIDPLPVPTVSFIEMDFDPPSSFYPMRFLLECDGEILLVRKIWEQQTGLKFQVFRADLALKVWVRLHSLQDHVLFLQHCGIPFSLSASQTGGHGNRIYFTGTRFQKLCLEDSEAEKIWKGWIEYDYGNHEVVGRKRSHLMDHIRKSSGRSGLFWIVPSLL